MQNRKGNFLRLQKVWRWIDSVYRFHPFHRFTSFAQVQAQTRLGYWELITLPHSVINRRFYVCYNVRNCNEIIKIPRGNNEFACKFVERFLVPGMQQKYETVIKNLPSDRWLGKHCAKVTAFRKNGGYHSEYVKGDNLAQLRDEMLETRSLGTEYLVNLKEALKSLLIDLHGYVSEHGQLIGDWPLHNLIYCADQRRIINVDSEGFFTYDGSGHECRLEFIESNILNFIELIKLMISRDRDASKVLDVFRILDRVRRGEEQYSGAQFIGGYHTLELDHKRFRGQRECFERLANVPFDFADKIVVDLGCNAGGMLHALAKRIKKGYGFDHDSKCVNLAQLIRSLNKSANLEFFTYDLDKKDLTDLRFFLLGEKVDICLLLSVCRWLAHWEDVIRTASQLAEHLLFESNGSKQQQEAQLSFLRICFSEVTLVRETSEDDFSHSNRKLYLCSKTPLLKINQYQAEGDISPPGTQPRLSQMSSELLLYETSLANEKSLWRSSLVVNCETKVPLTRRDVALPIVDDTLSAEGVCCLSNRTSNIGWINLAVTALMQISGSVISSVATELIEIITV
jgi:2-polyprenyl-3-methyl-5-hydroxy-6-metoxy-1,4-benzoquinol methylase